MGYCQNWYKNPKLDKDIFKAFSLDCKKVLEKSGIPLTHLKNGKDVDGYKVTDKCVMFNGAIEDGYETFYFARNTYKDGIERDGKFFGFCKTNRKPYDICVVACLILAKIHFQEDVILTTDATIPDEWEEGAKLVKEATSYDFNYGLSEDESVFVSVIEKVKPLLPEDLIKKKLEEEQFKSNPNYDLVG